MPEFSDEKLQQVVDLFWETIPPAWNSVRSQVRSIATEKFDVTVEQFHILRHIRGGACSVSELAVVGHISRPAISQAIELLVNKGLVSRQTSLRDRRFGVLGLTPQGAGLLEKIFCQASNWMKTRLSRLEKEDLEVVKAGLTHLRETLCEA